MTRFSLHILSRARWCSTLQSIVVSAIAATLLLGPSIPNSHAGSPTKGKRLFVLDSNNGAAEAQVLILDGESGRVLHTIKTGSMPDFALSPDGRRLYIGSTYFSDKGSSDKILVADSASGSIVAEIPTANRLIYNSIPIGSSMVFSPNGRWLFIGKYEIIGTANTNYWIDVLDTRTNKFLPVKAPLPLCGWMKITPTEDDLRVRVLCTDTQDLREVSFVVNDRNEAAFNMKNLARHQNASFVPEMNRTPTGPDMMLDSFFTLGSKNVVILKDGNLLEYRDGAATFLRTSQVGFATSRMIRTAALSANGRSIVFGVTLQPHAKTINATSEVALVDVATSNMIGPVATSVTIDFVSGGQDGSFVYGVDTWNSRIAVLDGSTLKETRVFTNVGRTPSLVLEYSR